MIRFPITTNVAADLVSLFREGLRRSKVTEGEGVVVYADTLSNPQYPAAFLAAAKDLGAKACLIIQPAVSKLSGLYQPFRVSVSSSSGVCASVTICGAG